MRKGICPVLRQKVEKELSGYKYYVSDGYFQRNQGYDWVAVILNSFDKEKIKVQVRSRADRKKPTCTFDATAFKLNDSVYYTSVEGKEVLFEIHTNSLEIKTKNIEDDAVLMFYCSGGASIAGKYKKIVGELDKLQMDKTLFAKILQLQGIGFNISSIREEGKNMLTVTPFGLEIINRPETLEIDGRVVDAEIEDLNSDGSPEVLVYTQSDGSGSYGNVYGYSVNNKKSMSQIYFPPIAKNKDISNGYMGHDEFAIVETSLVRRFPIYKENDTNANPSGGMRQIQYKLHDGEAMRKFVVNKVTEF